MNIDLIRPSDTHAEKRIEYYPIGSEQLDALWHDVHNGLFGESAKTGTWYLAVKAVKDKYPSS